MIHGHEPPLQRLDTRSRLDHPALHGAMEGRSGAAAEAALPFRCWRFGRMILSESNGGLVQNRHCQGSPNYSGRPVAGARSWVMSTCAGLGVRSSIAPVPASMPAPMMPPTSTFPAMATPPPVETLLVTVTVAG